MAKVRIVDEVRRVREGQAAKYAFDVKAILAAAKKRQRRSGHRVVSFVPRKRLSA
jgi:hypothetical protein